MALNEMATKEAGAGSVEARAGSKKRVPADPKEAVERMLIGAHRIAVALGEGSIFQESGLSVAEWALLKELGSHPDTPMKKVAAAAGISRQRLRKVVSGLEAKGLVSLSRAQESDKRARKISATAKAADVLSAVTLQVQNLISGDANPKHGRAFVVAARALDRMAKAMWKKEMKKPSGKRGRRVPGAELSDG